MKIVKHYLDDFKREIVQHYLSSDDSMQKTADKFKLAVPASVGQWVSKFGGEFRTSVMNKSPEFQIIGTDSRRTPQFYFLRQF